MCAMNKRYLVFIPILLITVIKLFAQETPQFLMPFYFEDANGDKDTVYLGYDPEARNNQGIYLESTRENANMDTIFGEKWVQIDTSKFNVFLWVYPTTPASNFRSNPLTTDSVLKTEVLEMKLYNQALYTQFGFTKGKMPLKFSWDKELLYSENLPFDDISPMPRARMEVTCEASYPCPHESDVLYLTDYPDNHFNQIFTDSIVFTPHHVYDHYKPISTQLITFNIRMVPYDEGFYVNNTVTESVQKVTVFPNPGYHSFSIENNDDHQWNYKLYNISGELISGSIIMRNSVEVIGKNIESGSYYLVFTYTDKVFRKKLVKLK